MSFTNPEGEQRQSIDELIYWAAVILNAARFVIGLPPLGGLEIRRKAVIVTEDGGAADRTPHVGRDS